MKKEQTDERTPPTHQPIEVVGEYHTWRLLDGTLEQWKKTSKGWEHVYGGKA